MSSSFMENGCFPGLSAAQSRQIDENCPVQSFAAVLNAGCGQKHFQFGKKVKWSTKEGNISANWLSTGKAADCLVDHSLKNGGGKISLGSPLIDQRLNIRFGKYPTARRNGIDGFIILAYSLRPEASVCKREAIWSIKEPRTTSADTIHALINTIGKIYNFLHLPRQAQWQRRSVEHGPEELWRQRQPLEQMGFPDA